MKDSIFSIKPRQCLLGCQSGHSVYETMSRITFFVKARMEGSDKRVDVFFDNLNRLFHFEREYDREMITDGERTRQRQGLPTMEAMINLLQELKNEEEQKSCYMREALNYLHKFWEEAFTYIKDGRYPISNNLAERAVRPFTTKRKNSLYFGSDEGRRLLPYTIA